MVSEEENAEEDIRGRQWGGDGMSLKGSTVSQGSSCVLRVPRITGSPPYVTRTYCSPGTLSPCLGPPLTYVPDLDAAFDVFLVQH